MEEVAASRMCSHPRGWSLPVSSFECRVQPSITLLTCVLGFPLLTLSGRLEV